MLKKLHNLPLLNVDDGRLSHVTPDEKICASMDENDIKRDVAECSRRRDLRDENCVDEALVILLDV